jgi:acetyl-CoA synthetase
MSPQTIGTSCSDRSIAGTSHPRPRSPESQEKTAVDEPHTPRPYPSSFPPPAKFVEDALVSDRHLYDDASVDFEEFWAAQARNLIDWQRDFRTTLEWTPPDARWFVEGRLNVSYNCLDRHVIAGNGARVAFHWEGEPGDRRLITYEELLEDVQRFANVLKGFGLNAGDRVVIYMPMIPELPVAMLACARIGVAHSVIFAGLSPTSLAERCSDAGARLIVTADAGYRRGAPSPLKDNVDRALDLGAPSVEAVIVVDRCNTDVAMRDGRDHWWHDLIASAGSECGAEPFDAEQLLFLLYTSGSTAKPKGIMHTSGGYLTQVAFTHRYVFDLRPDTDVYWCTADIGWVTGHSYAVYGPLANGCTSVLYEGTPDTPRSECRQGDRASWPKDRFWEIVETYGVTQLYTAPTAIRTFMTWGEQWPASANLSSLRVLGTVGESINSEAWMWYHTHIGGNRCPIVDTWWQTETGAHMIAPLPGVTYTKPGTATAPLPGIFVEVVNDVGEPVVNGDGLLTVTAPWPAMLRGIWGDPARYLDTYWSQFPGRYFTGDGARIDTDGHIWIIGRVDDVMNVSGHRISTTEIESALIDHPSVVEAACIGVPDALTGQAVVGYVTIGQDVENTPELADHIRQHVAFKLGPIAKPQRLEIVDELPKTRSGKIMRRVLRDIAEGRPFGDLSTLADATVVTAIAERHTSQDDKSE